MDQQWNNIKSFAILDLETSNLPFHSFNKCGITEISVYGFVASELKDCKSLQHGEVQLPSIPRVLHKLTLMINPRRLIDPVAEDITGLNNYMLEHESSFNENAAISLISFLRHLQQPICLVSHNGDHFDFPIVKQTLNKLNMRLPPNVLCVDSLNAFRDIDVQRKLNPLVISEAKSDGLEMNGSDNKISDVVVIDITATVEEAKTSITSDETKDENPLIESDKVNWSQINETTPKRPTNSTKSKTINICTKRRLSISFNEVSPRAPVEETQSIEVKLRSTLFPDDETPIKRMRQTWKRSKMRHPRGTYKLVNIYERTFGHPPKESHRAEADVIILTKLLLHYGNDFLSYAEQWAIPFDEIKPLGTQ